ncbi:uncharacterized protein LOC133297930 [Gastrolobium bilobum]|uniref:uncharacterized protein LOC133297930 n=1 Tax=Gastrolobium bilobum TaxID=150636 RepID=UPI002AAF7454|nr:uncharacterized protein LOC133297930 [Gastrolobium bilobum]
MRITRGTSFEGLKANIHHKLGLQENQHISEVTVRALAGNSEYTAITITDDDDVDIILDIFVEQAETSFDQSNAIKFMEIYVNFENTDDLSIPIRSLDLNTAPGIDMLNKNASSSVLPVVPNNAIFDDEDIPTYDHNNNDEQEEDEDACLAADNNDDESNSEDDDDEPIGSQDNVNISTSTGIVGYQNVIQGNNVTPNVGHNVGPSVGHNVGPNVSPNVGPNMAVKSYCMKINKEAVVVENTTMKLVLGCKNQGTGCPWCMRAMKPKNGLIWVVSRWEGPHNCVICNLSQDHRQLDSAFIASTILGEWIVSK